MKAKLMLLALAFAFLFFGCAALEGGGYRESYGDSSPGISYAPSVDYAYEEAYSAGTKTMVIKEGSVRVKVEQGTLEEKKSRLSDLIRENGAEVAYVGYNEYSTETQYWGTLKIAPGKFDAFMESLKELGEIKSIDTSLEDVTEQYVDINTRISNLQKELERLNALYEKAEKVDEILSIEREVTRVQTELEIYERQKLDLERRSAKSTITVTLVEEKPPVEKDLFVPLEQLGAVFFGAMGAAIMIIAGALGFIIPGLVVLAILYLAYKALFARKKK
ncbi:MAG: DUF4349 domain-containing protein [Candidatus Bilamarchaeaceae archaeon]